jgi:hypothetical protein
MKMPLAVRGFREVTFGNVFIVFADPQRGGLLQMRNNHADTT